MSEAPSTPPIAIGDLVLDRYRAVEHIANGGHSVVYLGRDERLARPVCIKVFTRFPGDPGISQTSYEHFVQEAFALSRLTHPHTLRIYDFGHLAGETDEADKIPFHVSEYMNGGTLSQLVRERGALMGRGLVFDGAEHASYTVNYPVSADCPWHEPPAPIEAPEWFSQTTPLRKVWQESTRELGALDAIDLAREVVAHVRCSRCEHRADVFRPADAVTADAKHADLDAIADDDRFAAASCEDEHYTSSYVPGE